MVTYSLTPEEQYPTQLRQSVEALRYVLTDTHRRPGCVILGGDSAGGNLALGVLAHIAHKHDDITRLQVSEHITGLVTIAPWTKLRIDDNQPSPYHGGDIVTVYAGKVWAANYVDSADKDCFTDASDAPTDWFRAFPVRKVLVLAGGNEIMLSDIAALAGRIKVRHS